MPKMKTHKGAAKRFRVTKNGKIMRGKAYKSHILTKKSPTRKRNFRKPGQIADSDRNVVKKNLGIG
jgi:large subunit ribosomal protein L35